MTNNSELEETYDRYGDNVLLVEGLDDVPFFTSLLSKQSLSLQVVKARGKKKVLKGLKDYPRWYGIIDRDEWSDRDSRAAQLSNLFVLPRWCAENYFITESIERHNLQISDQEYERFIRHGILWKIVVQLKIQLEEQGFPQEIVSHRRVSSNDNEPLLGLTTPEIRELLQSWRNILDVDAAMNEFTTTLERVLGLPRQEQWAQWIHGKYFFKYCLVPELCKAYKGTVGSPGNDQKEWAKVLTTGMDVPEDLRPLFAVLKGRSS